MAERWRRGVRWLWPVGAVAAVAAPFAAHLAISTGRFTGGASLLAAAAVLAGAAQAARRLRGAVRVAVLAGACALAALAAARLVWPALGPDGLMAASGLTHAAIYLSLLAWFACSLRPGRTPVVSALAARVRGSLSPAVAAYTRAATVAWCGVFLLQLAVSVVLAAAGPRWAWSLWVNVLDAPVLAVAFAAEYAVRRWRLRGERHSAPLAALRGFARMRADGG